MSGIEKKGQQIRSWLSKKQILTRKKPVKPFKTKKKKRETPIFFQPPPSPPPHTQRDPPVIFLSFFMFGNMAVKFVPNIMSVLTVFSVVKALYVSTIHSVCLAGEISLNARN